MRINNSARLNRRAALGQAHDAGHAAGEALARELRQQDGQEAALVAAQHVVRHAAACCDPAAAPLSRAPLCYWHACNRTL